jgi:predicted nucleic acid-binding protein
VAELILDASVLGALFLNEDGAEGIHQVVKIHHIYAPSFWRFEVSNAVWKKRGIYPEISRNIIERIWRFPVRTSDSEELALESLMIACKYGITFYDSF